MGLNNRGYFFVVDAMLAAIILAIGLFILYSTSIRAAPVDQSLSLIEDFSTLLGSTEIASTTNTYYLNTLLPNNLVLYPDETVFEELGYLSVLSSTDPSYAVYASTYAESLMNSSLDARYGSAIVINGSTLYSRPIAKSSFFLNRSTLVYVRMNDTTVYGPLIAEVHIWS
jgi:hypothetical protein